MACIQVSQFEILKTQTAISSMPCTIDNWFTSENRTVHREFTPRVVTTKHLLGWQLTEGREVERMEEEYEFKNRKIDY